MTDESITAAATPPGEPAASAATPPAKIARRELVLLFVAAVALQAIAWSLVIVVVRRVYPAYWNATIPDMQHYADVVYSIHQGAWPYTQFPFEYPPLTLVPLLIPPDVLPFTRYLMEFRIEMLVVFGLNALVTTWVALKIWATSGRALAAAAVLALTVPVTGVIALNRFDPTLALVIILCVLFLVYRRWALAGLMVGLGFSLKLMPIVLLPLVLILARKWRAVWWAMLAAAAGAVIPFVPFVAQDPAKFYSSLVGTQTGRGLQIESVAASPFLLRSIFQPGSVTVVVPPGGSLSISAAGEPIVNSLTPLFVLALMLVVYLVIWQARRQIRAIPEAVPVAVLALMVATMCGNKVLSPQHLIWVLPLVALAFVARRWSLRIPALLMFAAMILTQIEFPGKYIDIVYLKPTAIIVIAVRNLLLVAVLVSSLVALWRLQREEPAPAATARTDAPAEGSAEAAPVQTAEGSAT